MQTDREWLTRCRDALFPTLHYLTQEFGTKFDLEDCGGGCSAIQAEFLGEKVCDQLDHGVRLYITDSEEHPEATAERHGWHIGVYAMDEYGQDGDPIVFVDLGGRHTNESTAALVRAALAAANEMVQP